MRKVSKSIFDKGPLNGFYYGYNSLKEIWRKFLFLLNLDNHRYNMPVRIHDSHMNQCVTEQVSVLGQLQWSLYLTSYCSFTVITLKLQKHDSNSTTLRLNIKTTMCFSTCVSAVNICSCLLLLLLPLPPITAKLEEQIQEIGGWSVGTESEVWSFSAVVSIWRRFRISRPCAST